MLPRGKWILAISAVCTLALGVWILAFRLSGPFGVSFNDQEVEIYIEKGTRSLDIAHILAEKGVLFHPYGFLMRAYFLGKLPKLQAGEYIVKHRMPMAELIEKIARGDVIHRTITVVEGATVSEIVKSLKDNTLLSGEIDHIPPEGSLFPATYPCHRGEERADLLIRMQKTMSTTLQELWNTRNAIHCPIESPQEALILASIIEKETSIKREEQPHIAGVFFHRLHKKMRLQSDPTVIYAMTLGKQALGRALTRSDLSLNSPFNTYRHHGLPPTPIACPGKTALEAVLHPTKTEDLFFVASGTGGHNFAKNLVEHNENVKKWRLFCATQKASRENSQNVPTEVLEKMCIIKNSSTPSSILPTDKLS